MYFHRSLNEVWNHIVSLLHVHLGMESCTEIKKNTRETNVAQVIYITF